MKKALLFLPFLFAVQSGYSTIYTAIASGNYESAAIWSPAGGPPGTDDDIIIPAGLVVTVTTTNTAKLDGLNVFGILDFANGGKLNFSSSAFIKIAPGGSITAAGVTSEIVFPDVSYPGPFNSPGTYYYSNYGSGSVTLPIKLTVFKGESVTKGIKIFWATENEINIDTYEVEWSATGTGGWQTIFTQKAGNLSTPNNYSYVHYTGLQEKNFYRLKTTELNGNFYYSGIIVTSKNNNINFRVAPSIATNSIVCTMASAAPCTLKITDLSGKTVSVMDNIRSNQRTIWVDNLPKGIYFISLIQNNITVTEKFIKE